MDYSNQSKDDKVLAGVASLYGVDKIRAAVVLKNLEEGVVDTLLSKRVLSTSAINPLKLQSESSSADRSSTLNITSTSSTVSLWDTKVKLLDPATHIVLAPNMRFSNTMFYARKCEEHEIVREPKLNPPKDDETILEFFCMPKKFDRFAIVKSNTIQYPFANTSTTVNSLNKELMNQMKKALISEKKKNWLSPQDALKIMSCIKSKVYEFLKLYNTSSDAAPHEAIHSSGFPKEHREKETLQVHDWDSGDFQVKAINRDPKAPILLSDDSRLRWKDEVTKLYPSELLEQPTTSSSSSSSTAQLGWKTRTNCPCRPVNEFQLLCGDGTPMVLMSAIASAGVSHDDPTQNPKKKVRFQANTKITTSSSTTTSSEVHFVFPFGNYDGSLKGYGNDKLIMFCVDLERLEPKVFLNDSLIDFKIFHILLNLSPEKREAVHLLGCSFYSNLQSFRRKQVQRYNELLCNIMRVVNIFTKDFILIPINVKGSLHWSLCIIVRPLQYLLHRYISDEEKHKFPIIGEEKPQRGCILHMNSYPSIHSSKEICDQIQQALSDMWMLQRSKETFSTSVTSYLSHQGLSVDETIDIVGLINTRIDSRGERHMFEYLPSISCKVPIQPNGYDCGVYILKFVECVLGINLSTHEAAISTSLIDQVNENLFSHEDLKEYRADLRNTLNTMAAEYKIWKQDNPSYGNDDELEEFETADGGIGFRIATKKDSPRKFVPAPKKLVRKTELSMATSISSLSRIPAVHDSSSEPCSSLSHVVPPQPNNAMIDTGEDANQPDDALDLNLDSTGISISSAKTLPPEVRDIMAQSFTELRNNREAVLGGLVDKLQPFIKKRGSFDPNEYKQEIKGVIRDNYLSETEKNLLIQRQVGKRKEKNRIQQRVRDMFETLKTLLRIRARSSVSSVYLGSSQGSSTQDSSQAASDITTSSNGSSYQPDDNEEEEDDSDDDNSAEEEDDKDDEKSIDVDSKEEARSKTRQKEKKPPTTSKVFLKNRKDSKSTVNKRSALVRAFNEGDRELFSLFHSADPATNTSEPSMSNELEVVDDTALEDTAVVEDVLNTLLKTVHDTAVEDRAVVEDVLNNPLVGFEVQLQPSSAAIQEANEQSDVIIDPNKHPLLYAVAGISKKGSNFVKCGVTAGRKVKFNSRCRGYLPGKQKLI
eukprot:gene31028-40363_t